MTIHTRHATAAGVLAAVLAVPPAAPAQTSLFGGIRPLDTAVDYAEMVKGSSDAPPANGLYPEFGDLITGAGWIALGPGYHHSFLDGKAHGELSAALSWRAYKMAQARIEFEPPDRWRMTIGAQARWHDYTQISYFGTGADSLAANRSEYRLQAADVVGYAALRVRERLVAGARFGWLDRPSLDSSSGPFRRGLPDTRSVFPDDPGVGVERQPSYMHGEVWFVSDTRNHRSYPTRGGLYRLAHTSFVAGDGGAFSFGRYDLEALQLVPFSAIRSVLAFHAAALFANPDGSQVVPFYLLPSLGGHNTLRAYTDYRFHDRTLLLVNVESRWLLFRHVDAVAFVDAGSVAPRARDLDLEKRGYGVGIRVHSERSTFARIDVAHGAEGWHAVVKLNDPFRLARLARATAAIPFAP